MSLSDGVVQGREALAVGGVEGAAVPEQQRRHGHGADGGGAVDGVLAAAVADARRGRRLGREEEARDVHVLL